MNTLTRGFDAVPETRSHDELCGLPVDRIEAHDTAFVVPFRRGIRSGTDFHAGVFDAQGDALPHAEMKTMLRASLPTREVRDAALAGAETLTGKWLFCGIASSQFGHVITRGLGRLWATEHVPEEVQLLFVSMLYNEDQHRFLTRLLDQMGIRNCYKILQNPTHVERLITAPDLFSEASHGTATPEYAKWVRQRTIPPHDTTARRKLYITRSRLSPCVGRCLNEDLLEKNLENAGFEIIAPETLDLADQFKLYAEAEIIVASEGSALHIVPFSMRDTATLVVVQRRKEVPDLIANQISSFTPARVTYVDAIRDVYWPKQRADNLSLVSLDFLKLRDDLIAAGALDNSSSWRVPTRDEEMMSLHEGRPADAVFLSDEERAAFLRVLRRQRRARRAA
ncbi:MAG: DUF563 domain-containing protein [Pelagibaca sp.]